MTTFLPMKNASFALSALLLVQPSFAAITETTLSFQQGANSYSGALERRLGVNTAEDATGADVDTVTESFFLDGGPTAADRKDLLVRFDDVMSQLPSSATITKAELVVKTTEDSVNANSPSGAAYNVYRLTESFDTSTSFTTISGGNGVESGVNADLISGSFKGMNTAGSFATADVTRIMRSWSSGDPVYGFGIKSERSGDGWSLHTSGSSDQSARPELRVTYTTDPVEVLTFQQGIAGYSEGLDVLISAGEPSTVLTSTAEAFIDGSDGGNSYDVPYLLKFGEVENSLRSGMIERATLTLVTGYSSRYADMSATGAYTLHQLLEPFDENTVYDEYAGDVGAMIAAGEISDAVAVFEGVEDTQVVEADVTSIVENWADGDMNYGLYIGSAGTSNGWQIFTNHATNSEFAPRLTVIQSIPEPSSSLLALGGLLGLLRRRR